MLTIRCDKTKSRREWHVSIKQLILRMVEIIRRILYSLYSNLLAAIPQGIAALAVQSNAATLRLRNGQRHNQYLKEHRHIVYTTMLIEGTLNSYLADVDRQAQDRLLLLTKQIAEQENVTEQLKVDNTMLWVQKMNEIQSRVRDLIYSEIIYA